MSVTKMEAAVNYLVFMSLANVASTQLEMTKMKQGVQT
jgi:hypothetical protein